VLEEALYYVISVLVITNRDELLHYLLQDVVKICPVCIDNLILQELGPRRACCCLVNALRVNDEVQKLTDVLMGAASKALEADRIRKEHQIFCANTGAITFSPTSGEFSLSAIFLSANRFHLFVLTQLVVRMVSQAMTSVIVRQHVVPGLSGLCLLFTVFELVDVLAFRATLVVNI